MLSKFASPHRWRTGENNASKPRHQTGPRLRKTVAAPALGVASAGICAVLFGAILFAASAHAKKTPPANRVDVNTATAAQLAQIPGIGPGTARAIIQFREKSGPFQRLEDLLAIRGITDRKLALIKPYATVGPRPGAKPAPPGATRTKP